LRELVKKTIKEKQIKWLYVPTNSKEFEIILDTLTKEIKSGNLSANESINLVEKFKIKNKGWVKFNSVKGRSVNYCECLLITENKNKIKINLSCEFVMNAERMIGTPSSNKLLNKISSKKWKKPDDGFVDPCNSDFPIEEELTELGYEMYKSWHQEIENSGMSRDEYIKKLFNIPFFTRARI
jgi:hypothetical protein